jgi:REP element-mobilizing transposase RayT
MREVRRDFRVIEYSIQSNHAHFMIEAASAAERVGSILRRRAVGSRDGS